jgi:voltage-gated potassium channel
MSVRLRLRAWLARHALWLDVVMAVLALAYILIGEFNDGLFGFHPSPGSVALEIVITTVFVAEYAMRLYAAEDRLRFVRTHVLELLALISTLRLLRGFQFLRIFRLLRIARLATFSVAFVRVMRALHALNRGLSEPLFAYGILGLVGLVFFGALALFNFEKGANPQIHDFADAFWLAVSIVLTVGISAAKPMTDEGRAISGFLIIGGLTCVSFFSSAMAVRLQRNDRDQVVERLERIERILARMADRGETLSLDALPALPAASEHD